MLPVLNSIISELVAVLEHAGVAYQAGRLNNLALAISIIAARGSRLAADVEVRALKAEINVLKQEIAALKVVRAKAA